MPYSHSQLKTYDECPFRYRLRYIDKVPEPQTVESPALKFWSIIHSTLEQLYKKIQESWLPPTIDFLQTYFCSEMENYRASYDQLSESPFPESDFNDRLALGVSIITRYYETYKPFTQTNINGLEQMIHFELPNGEKFRGIIDRLDFEGDTAIITDYKTDKSIAPYEAFEDAYQQQLTSYAVRVQQKYKHAIKKIKGKLIYLRLHKEIEREITPEMLQNTIQKIEEKIAEIQKTLFDYNMGQKEAFEAKEWTGCRRCAYQMLCPIWKHKFADDEVLMTDIGETTIKKQVDLFYKLSSEKKALEEQVDTIKEFLEAYVLAHSDENWKNLYGNEASVRVDRKEVFKPKDEIKKSELKDFLVENQLFDLVSMTINDVKFTKFLDEKPEIKAKLADLVEKVQKITVGWAKKN